MIEITALRSTVDYLVEEIRNLKARSQPSSQNLPESLPEPLQILPPPRISVLPEPASGFNPNRNTLEKMTTEQYKNFRIS
jgi:hypothetical protein